MILWMFDGSNIKLQWYSHETFELPTWRLTRLVVVRDPWPTWYIQHGCLLLPAMTGHFPWTKKLIVEHGHGWETNGLSDRWVLGEHGLPSFYFCSLVKFYHCGTWRVWAATNLFGTGAWPLQLELQFILLPSHVILSYLQLPEASHFGSRQATW